jgi:hypothetical protein
MRLCTLASIGLLSLTLGIPAVNAQDDKPRSAEPAPEPAKPDTAAKPAQQDDMKPMQQDQDKMKQDENKPANEAKPSKEEKQQQKEQEKEAKQGGHPEGGQAAAKGHIPDNQFKAHFGRSHTFTVNHPTVVGGQPRFQYSGYWFVISQPWPVGWAYTDQCYIDYIDGEYILFDLLHPGVQVVLVIAD